MGYLRAMTGDFEVRYVRPGARFLLGGRGVPPVFTETHGVAVCSAVSDAVGQADALMHLAPFN